MRKVIQRSQDLIREKYFLGKGGMLEDIIDERDYPARNHLRVGIGRLPDFVDNYSMMSPYNQKKTNHCTAYTASGAWNCQIIAKTHNQSIVFDPEQQWKNQLEYPGTADEKKGDYVVSGAKALKKYGLNYLWKNYRPEKYTVVDKEDWKRFLSDGHNLLVGGGAQFPFTDKNYYWNPIKSSDAEWGHAFFVVGYDNKAEHYICQNSWGRWGHRHTGRFYVRYKDAPLLFRAWIIS